MACSTPEKLTLTQPGTAPVAGFPQLRKKRRAELAAAIKTVNRSFNHVASAVRREFVAIDWERQSRASVVGRITEAIQSVDSASVDVLNQATRTIIQEIYAIDEWPTTKRVVLTRATAAIRRLKLGA